MLYTTSKERALGLLYDKRILRCDGLCPGSHISGGVIFAGVKMQRIRLLPMCSTDTLNFPWSLSDFTRSRNGSLSS